MSYVNEGYFNVTSRYQDGTPWINNRHDIHLQNPDKGFLALVTGSQYADGLELVALVGGYSENVGHLAVSESSSAYIQNPNAPQGAENHYGNIVLVDPDHTKFLSGGENFYSGGYSDQFCNAAYKGGIVSQSLKTNLPIFRNDEDGWLAYQKYKSTGDYSGAINADDIKFGRLYMDIYVDGSKRPNIKVGFTTENDSSSDDNPYTAYVDMTVQGASVDKFVIKSKPVGFGQTFATSFDSIVGSADLNLLETALYNVSKLWDGITILITGTVYKSISQLGKASGSVTYKAKTTTISEDNLTIRWHTGADTSESDGYVDPSENSDNTDGTNPIDTVGLLTTTYILTKERLNNIANKLWDSTFLDSLKLVNNNPIENVCSVRVLPIDISGVDKEVYIGNVAMGINGEEITKNAEPYFSTKLNISLKSDLPVWANYAPFTKLSIYLPYIGYKDLDVNRFMGGTLQVKYIVDVLTGMCKAVILNKYGKVVSYDGNVGIDIPLTASNSAQQSLAYLTSVAGAVGSIATKDVGGLAQNLIGAVTNPFTSQTVGANSPTTSSNEGNVISLYIDYPHIQYPSTFNHDHGLPCNLSLVLGQCHGFTQVKSDSIDLSGIPCIAEEKERLKEILASGFYANW